MCGISGLYSCDGRDLDLARARRDIEAAGAAIAHRGPDASGTVMRAKVAFGHRRLAILDLNPRANQPMASPDGKVLVTYNGEIYNFRELRAELECAGHAFATTSDTEVLVCGYRHWGLGQTLARAAGMFAFALYDETAGKLFLARDRAGKKPLYWALDQGRLCFCSELRGIFAMRPGPRQVCREGLECYLALKYAPAPLTLVDGVKKVPPGCYLEFGTGEPKTAAYWSPLSKQPASLAYGQACEQVGVALDLAVRRRLVSDVPVCVFLSGGIDSSLIVDAAAVAGAAGLAAYTVGYTDMPGYNEFAYARLVAQRYPIDHRELRVSSGEVL